MVEILFLQSLHLPPRIKKLKTGILSKGRTGVEQAGQKELGKIIDFFLGNRYIQTLAKLPIVSPRIKSMVAINENESELIISILC